MIRTLLVLACLALAACGADGDPIEPAGSVAIGIGSEGLSAGGSIGVRRGPLQVGVGIF
ncbi:hypothetical protein [uncultured Tateyamaria sp.]|uniref:hypothetical protein n=1 Tax=uncultured Tateyamaria sp. TaxID=455651 RepID=UPI002619AEDE|nr:hypothetical protein [uncultured Tateyamaria sp.]